MEARIDRVQFKVTMRGLGFTEKKEVVMLRERMHAAATSVHPSGVRASDVEVSIVDWESDGTDAAPGS